MAITGVGASAGERAAAERRGRVEVGFGEITGLIGLSRRRRFRECLPAQLSQPHRCCALAWPAWLRADQLT